MKINSAFSQATLGIQRGLQSAQRHSAQIANTDTMKEGSPSSLIEPLAGLTQDKLQVQSSAKVLKTLDEMLGRLLNEKT